MLVELNVNPPLQDEQTSEVLQLEQLEVEQVKQAVKPVEFVLDEQIRQVPADSPEPGGASSGSGLDVDPEQVRQVEWQSSQRKVVRCENWLELHSRQVLLVRPKAG